MVQLALADNPEELIATFSIRQKTRSDLKALRIFFLAARIDTFTWLDTTPYKLLDFDDQTRGESVWMAVAAGEVIGFISLWPADNFIHHLYVGAQHQQQRVGTALLNCAVETMNFPIRLKCAVSNTNAIAFYTRKGFQETMRGVSDEGVYMVFERAKR